MIFSIINIFFQVYMLMLLARIILSWVPELHHHRAVQFLAFYTDPYLNLFRRIIPPLGMIDFSPIVAFFCLGIIEKLLKMALLYLLR